MHDTYEHGSLAALKSPVFIDITLMTGGPAGTFGGCFAGGCFAGGGFADGDIGRLLLGTFSGGFDGDGFGVGEIGRLLSAGLTFIMEFKFDGGV